MPADLETVTGGTTSSSSDLNDQLTTALQSITDSLASLKNNNSNNSFAQLMPFMMMMMMSGGGGCGCGMHGCIRCYGGGGGCGGIGW